MDNTFLYDDEELNTEETPQRTYAEQLDEIFKPMHEPTEDGEYFTEDDYKELQRNLVLYKEGNQEAITYIIRAFHPFLTKYVRFIKDGDLPYTQRTNKNGRVYNKVSPTITSFAKLFMGKASKEEKKKQFSSTCFRIKELFEKYEYEDIYNELVLALLNMANKYKITKEGDVYHKENGTFHMYVSKCFHWEAYRFLIKMIDDPLVHFDILSLKDQFDDMDEDDPGKEVFVEDKTASYAFDDMINAVNRQGNIARSHTLTMKENTKITEYEDESLNFNWTNGVTCGKLFAGLSPYEREIIILSFIEKKTDIEIGQIYGYHRATINEHKKAAVRKVKTAAEELNILKGE